MHTPHVVLAATVCLWALAHGQPVVQETFDTGLNGWTTYADASGLTWEPDAGNPGGCARAVDLNTGVLWGFAAPELFLGDKSCYVGGTLSWDTRTTHTSTSYANVADVTLESTGLLLVHNVPGNPPANVWVRHSVALSASAWRVSAVNGRVPTDDEFVGVLATLVGMRFNCEWSTAVDTGRIDNVVLTPGDGCGVPCDPDFNGDGNVDQDDIACLAQVVAGDLSCSDIDPDFNGDGNVDQDDIDALAQVVAGAECP